jgi:hypothetical protein
VATMGGRQKQGIAGDKSICIPVVEESDYRELVKDLEKFREYLDEVIEEHRELFPEGIEQGYRFMDTRCRCWINFEMDPID